MKSLYAIATALTLLATPVLAQTPAGDAELHAQTPVYQSIPAHQGVADIAQNGPAGDAEAHAQNIYTIQNVGTFAANQAVTATDAASTVAKTQAAQDESWRDQP
jgi:hypothetical protein